MIMLYLTGLCWENKAEVSLSLNFFNFKTWIFGVTLVSSVNVTFILLKLMSLICFFIKWISHLSCALKCIHKLFTITDVLPLVIKQSIINRVIISVLKKLLGSYQMFTWHHFAHSSINFALMNMAKTWLEMWLEMSSSMHISYKSQTEQGCVSHWSQKLFCLGAFAPL